MMGQAKSKFTPEPREWTDAQVAARLNMSMSYFSDHKRQLYAAGMPRPDPLLANKTDSKALEAWLDSRSGLGLANNDDEQILLRNIRARAS